MIHSPKSWRWELWVHLIADDVNYNHILWTVVGINQISFFLSSLSAEASVWFLSFWELALITIMYYPLAKPMPKPKPNLETHAKLVSWQTWWFSSLYWLPKDYRHSVLQQKKKEEISINTIRDLNNTLLIDHLEIRWLLKRWNMKSIIF